MSLELSRAENTVHPEHLQQNINASCYLFVVHLIDRLRAAGHKAYHVCKTAGEGQFTPPGFSPRTVIGLDGKPYTCTGVSHDAVWCDDKIFDTIGSGNDADRPIYRKSTDPFWSFDPADGPQIRGTPVWNAIPPQYWRPNNPPLKENGVPPEPPPPAHKPYPGDPVWDAVGVTLFADYAEAHQAPNPQMGRWFGRTIWDATEGDAAGHVLTVEASITKHRAEWRAILGLPPLP